MRRNNQAVFPTNRDRDAFGELLNRVPEIGYAKGELWRVEFVGNPVETDCDVCQCGHANIRVVWNYGKHSGFGSDEVCLSCFFRKSQEWLDNMHSVIKEQHHEYRANQQ
jgi:hypothetical protein